MKNKYRFEVQATRRVLQPVYGQEAYRLETVYFDYPYGRNAKYKNRNTAYIDALWHAIRLIPECSSVCVVKWRGLGGMCEYLKETTQTFSTGWPDERTQ